MRTLLLALAVLTVVAAPVAAHGNYLEADAQTSTDGTVVVEVLTHVVDGFLVLHADDGGDPGRAIGHTDPGEGPLATDLEVRIDPAYWANVTGNATVWVAFHRDEGAEGFAPADDPIQVAASGNRLAERISVGRRDNRSLVLAESTHEHTVDTSRVTVRRVELAEPGYLVLRADDGGDPGAVVGTRKLPAGVHRNVTVDVEESFYHDRGKRFSLWAVLHRTDGDGRFDPAADDPVTVGDDPVRSRFDLKRTGDLDGHGHEHGTPTATPTPTPTLTPTPTPTPEPATTAATDSPTPDRAERTPTPEPVTTPGATTTSGRGPGPGPGTAVVALAALALVALVRRVVV